MKTAAPSSNLNSRYRVISRVQLVFKYHSLLLLKYSLLSPEIWIQELCYDFVGPPRVGDHTTESCQKINPLTLNTLFAQHSAQTSKNLHVFLPETRQVIPAAKVTLALATSDPPILVHFIPMSVRTPPKKPVMTAQTASALQPCRNAVRKQVKCSFLNEMN